MKRVENIDGLELISHVPASPAHPVPLLFVHGAFVAAWVLGRVLSAVFCAARGKARSRERVRAQRSTLAVASASQR